MTPFNIYKAQFSQRALVFVFMHTWALTRQGEDMGQLNTQCDPTFDLTSSVNKTQASEATTCIHQINYTCVFSDNAYNYIQNFPLYLTYNI
jgi:hypothetical protein